MTSFFFEKYQTENYTKNLSNWLGILLKVNVNKSIISRIFFSKLSNRKLDISSNYNKINFVSFQMSPLNNNTLSSSSLQHHQHPQHHSHHGHNNPQQQHEMNVTSSSSPTSTFNTSVAKGSPPMTSVASNNECLASAPPGSSPSSLTTSSSSMSSVAAVSAVSADWTAALQRSAASQQMTTAFAGHGFPGMYGWY